jgi:protein-tyrosine-phosphatase
LRDKSEIDEPRSDPQEPPLISGERVVGRIKSSVKKLLPEILVEEVRRYRAYERSERLIYLKARISNSLGLGISRPQKMARSFVFVCFGNIIRSPMCEALMNRAVMGFSDGIAVTSAGLNATPGRPAHPWAIMSAHEFGITLENHRARLLTSEMIDRADAIFVMDYQNQVQLLSRWAHARSKVFMLSAYAGKDYPAVEICDPYYIGHEETRRCYKILNTCIQNLAESLQDRTQTTPRDVAEP